MPETSRRATTGIGDLHLLMLHATAVAQCIVCPTLFGCKNVPTLYLSAPLTALVQYTWLFSMLKRLNTVTSTCCSTCNYSWLQCGRWLRSVCKVLTQAHSCSIQHSKRNNGYQKFKKVRQISRTAAEREVLSLKRAGEDYSSDAMQEV